MPKLHIHKTSGPSCRILRVPLFTKIMELSDGVDISLTVFENEHQRWATLRTHSLLGTDTTYLDSEAFTKFAEMVTNAGVFFE